jgi:uncharacterized membrane protein (UPF0182 family)
MTLIAQPRPVTEPTGRWWWRPRVRSGLILAALATLVLGARLGAHLETDWLWFHELGQEQVFWKLLSMRWIAGTGATVATTAVLLANFWVVWRTAPAGEPPLLTGSRRRQLRYAVFAGCVAAAIAAGLLVGRSVVLGSWQPFALWAHRQEFGVVDPLFHKDLGFFIFSLPLYEKLAEWLLVTVGVALVSAVLAHVATGAIRLQPPPVSATRGAHAHVLALTALLLLLVAWKHWLGQYALELTRDNRTLPGAGYTEVHVLLAWQRALVIVALIGALLVVVAAIRRSWSLPAIAVVLVAVAELVNPAVLPSVVQRVFVEPQTLSRERPYLSHSIRFTQLAYGLDGVTERALPANATITPRELNANRDVLRNVQLWDTDVLRPQIDQQQSIGSYYTFPSTTVDRYRQGGRVRTMILAQRELDVTRLDPSGRTWANDHLAYTHGYGLVAAPAGEVGPAGEPRFVTSEFDAGHAPTRIRQPRIYYGAQPPGAQPWVIVKSRRPEIEKPLPGDAPEPDYHYSGSGGIPLGGVLSRAAFALRFRELNFLLSETINDTSRIVLRRDIGDRLRALAPFLDWEKRPEVIVVGGRVMFVAHGYTTSDSFPYSAQSTVAGRRVNYIRGSVLATVDAYSGRVVLYTVDSEDPLLKAWRGVFPTLFTPGSRMPAGVRAHLRYPRELFDVQSEVWETYHMDNVDDFYTKADAWDRPAEISGPVQKVGAIRFRYQHQSPRMKPYFLLARRPGDRAPRFMLTTVFTPHSQENLSGYLTGTMDAGHPRLTQLTLPRSRLVLGPSQVSRQILATTGVGNRLRLLNQETADLGTQAVNAVELSEPRVVPMGNSFLYVQPIYVTASGSGVTRVRIVTVYLNGHVGYGRDLAEALRVAQAAAGRRWNQPGGSESRPRRTPASVGTAHRSELKRSTASNR